MASAAKKINLSGSVNKSDRISNLPITLLHQILSFLPARDTVQTCRLSKKWRNIWCSVPSLCIDYMTFYYNGKSDHSYFERFVDFLLLTRDGSNIQKFSFSIEPEPESAHSESEAEAEPQAVAKFDIGPCKANAWILYALRHNVEVLELKSYMSLTPLLFSCESLRELNLSFTLNDLHTIPSLNLPSSVNVPFLRVLHLYRVDIQAGQLDDALFSAMPCLETLNLNHCRFSLKKLSIESTDTLKSLMMRGDFLDHFELSISAPNLKFLKLDSGGCPVSIKTIRFKNNGVQLINANIDLGVSCPESVIELFAVLRNTVCLKLSSSFLKSFTRQLQNTLCIADCIEIPFLNLTHMELRVVFTDSETLVINKILENSPFIEVLRMSMVWNTCDSRVKESFEEAEVWSRFKLCRLKSVDISDFQATENEMRFVKFILENAPVLEDMIITTARYRPKSKQELKIIGKELLLHPRSSPTLVMQFG